MKIFIVGYYGFKNFGDELLLYKIIGDILDIAPDAQFLVWSGDRDYTENFLRDYYVKAVDRFSLEETISAVKISDVVVLGGGGLIQEHYGLKVEHLFREFGRHIQSYAIPPLLGRIFGKRVFYWCLGHGPVVTEDGEEFSRWFYSLADVITLRDQYSLLEVKRLLPEAEVHIDTDPLFDFDFRSFSQDEIPNTIGFSIRKWFNEEEIVQNCSKALKEITESEGLKVIPIPCDLSSDKEVIKRVLEGLREESVVYIDIESVIDVIKAISSCRVFVGMRLHSLISAYMLGKPIVAISYDPKTEEFMNAIEGEYVRVTEISKNDIVLKVRKVMNSEVPEPINFEYKTPQIFRDFVSREKKRFFPSEFEQRKLDRHRRYTQDFVKNLFYQRSELYKRIAEAEGENEYLRAENMRLNKENEQLRDENKKITEQYSRILNEIYNSNIWRLAQKYYELRDKTFLRHLYPIYKPILNKFLGKQKTMANLDDDEKEKKRTLIKNFFQNNEKLVIMLSSIPFKQIYNQRPLNLSKQFAHRNYAVLFVSWQWSPQEIIPASYEEVYKGIFQVPFYDFIDFHTENFLNGKEKILYITFPFYDFIHLIRTFRTKGFKIVYDIMDDWEGFKNAGQAPWYEKEVEERLIIESDFIFAVKNYLKEKFYFLRDDIIVVGNGYDEELHGKDARFIAGTELVGDTFTIGYYGWLTEARFDWDFILNVAEKYQKIKIQLIGYALSDQMKSKILKFKNIEYIGEVEPSELKYYVAKWNMGVIPFKEHAIAKGSDPLKVYEYTYFGLPTIAKGISGIESNPLLIEVSTNDHIQEIFESFNSKDKIIEFREKNRESIIKFLEKTGWNSRIEKILQEICKATFWT